MDFMTVFEIVTPLVEILIALIGLILSFKRPDDRFVQINILQITPPAEQPTLLQNNTFFGNREFLKKSIKIFNACFTFLVATISILVIYNSLSPFETNTLEKIQQLTFSFPIYTARILCPPVMIFSILLLFRYITNKQLGFRRFYLMVYSFCTIFSFILLIALYKLSYPLILDTICKTPIIELSDMTIFLRSFAIIFVPIQIFLLSYINLQFCLSLFFVDFPTNELSTNFHMIMPKLFCIMILIILTTFWCWYL